MESGQEKNASTQILVSLGDALCVAFSDMESARRSGTTFDQERAREQYRLIDAAYHYAHSTIEQVRMRSTSSAEKPLNERTESQS